MLGLGVRVRISIRVTVRGSRLGVRGDWVSGSGLGLGLGVKVRAGARSRVTVRVMVRVRVEVYQADSITRSISVETTIQSDGSITICAETSDLA